MLNWRHRKESCRLYVCILEWGQAHFLHVSSIEWVPFPFPFPRPSILGILWAPTRNLCLLSCTILYACMVRRAKIGEGGLSLKISLTLEPLVVEVEGKEQLFPSYFSSSPVSPAHINVRNSSRIRCSSSYVTDSLFLRNNDGTWWWNNDLTGNIHMYMMG
jgi:hypothetical protein